MYEGTLLGKKVKMTDKFFERVMNFISPSLLQDSLCGNHFCSTKTPAFCNARRHVCEGCPLNLFPEMAYRGVAPCRRVMREILGKSRYENVRVSEERMYIYAAKRVTAEAYLRKLRSAFKNFKHVEA